MEIKSSEKIEAELTKAQEYGQEDQGILFTEFSNKKWVSVEDVIIELTALKTHTYIKTDEEIDKLIILLNSEGKNEIY